MTGCQQLFQHDGDLDAVGRAKRVKLKRMLADRQFFFELSARGGFVDAGKLAAARLLVLPDFGRNVFCFTHGSYSLVRIVLPGM